MAVAWVLAGALWGGWGGEALGATLDVDLEVRTRAEAAGGGNARQEKDVVILVLDRSGSMNQLAEEVGRPGEIRDVVLKEMLRNRLEMLAATRPDAEVWTISFANEITEPRGPYSARDADRIVGGLANPYGMTLLYDAMARAVAFGEDRMKNDPGARIWLYFYSDGDNYFQGTHWVNSAASWRNRRVRVEYNGPDAAERFLKDYGERIQSYADAGKMSMETGCWLGSGNPPVMIENKRKDEYPMELTADGTSLKNPASAPSQGLKARLLAPMPERYAKDLDKLEAALVFEAGGRRAVTRFPLAPGKKTVRLALPDGLPTEAFPGQLRVTGIPDAWKSVALGDPDPVELSFAAPGALSLSGMTPRGERWVAVGSPVEFSATATDEAEVTWTIDGKVAGKGTFEQAFDQAGDHRVVATATKAGFREARAECTVHAVNTGVSVSTPAGVRVGEAAAFEAKAAGGEAVSWWLDGQSSEGKGKRLDGVAFDKSGHHTVKARVYFGHGLSGEGEAHFEVSVAPHVAIDTPYSGEEFGFGEEIRAVAVVEGDFERVAWTLKGPDGAANTAEVDREAKASRPAVFKPGKGGDYELTATAEGPAGRVESQLVRFSVAREDAWVRIDEPASGASVPTGEDTVLRASAQGEEAREIRWTVKDAGGATVFSATRPTEGGVSQCAFRPPDTLGNGTTLFVSAEATGDSALRVEIDIETRCANCAAVGAVLSLSHDGDERRNFGRGEKIVAELKDLRGDVRDIEWTFGEDGRGAGRVAEWNGWTDYNVYPVRATGRCGKCGAVHDFGLESVIIERRPVTAAFEIKERGAYYTAGGKLHLASTCANTNDIADYVWTVDGEELAGFRGKPEAVVELPFRACDPVLALAVRGTDGTGDDYRERGIRVRFGWVAALLFLLAGVLILVPLWAVLPNNGPAGWKVGFWDGPEPLQTNAGWEKEKADIKFCAFFSIFKYWNPFRTREQKQARIPLDSLGIVLSDLSEDTSGESSIVIKPTSSTGKIEGLEGKLQVRDNMVKLLSKVNSGYRYYLFLSKSTYREKLKKAGRPPKALRLVLDTSKVSHVYDILLWLLTVLVLCGVAWASLRWAM